MKNYLKFLVIVLFITLTINTKVLAAVNLASDVILEGNAEGIVFIPGQEPFLNKENMVPGDQVSRKIVINNKHKNSYELFLRAERISNKEEYDLLNKLNLKITYKGQIIYDGVASGEDGISKDISLGVFKPGEDETLLAQVTLDGPTMGNEFRNKKAAVNWIFTATSKDIEENISPNNLPKTGDRGVVPYVVVIFLAFAAILVAKKYRMRKEAEK